jgi:hypothetical protein
MVLGTPSNVRDIAGHITDDEMHEKHIEDFMEAGTSYVVNKTGVLEIDWPDHEDFSLATIAAENYAAAFAVLVVSTVKDPTARHRELLGAAERALEAIKEGATDEGENPFFINENSEYQTYENNPLDVEPYESSR